tara:strand:+ start:6956 stop:7183 length:228 start_codon:yes stop_codon:yes gene_type:complete
LIYRRQGDGRQRLHTVRLLTLKTIRYNEDKTAQGVTLRGTLGHRPRQRSSHIYRGRIQANTLVDKSQDVLGVMIN